MLPSPAASSTTTASVHQLPAAVFPPLFTSPSFPAGMGISLTHPLARVHTLDEDRGTGGGRLPLPSPPASSGAGGRQVAAMHVTASDVTPHSTGAPTPTAFFAAAPATAPLPPPRTAS